MKTAAPQILVVDDEEDITTLLRDYLARFGLQVHIAADGDGMREQMSRHPIALLVLDIMLPGTDGLALAREVRAASPVPIIVLTARGHAYDRVLGLEIGADDYMAKPFEPRELLARIQTVLRRVAASPEGPLQDVARFDGWALHRQDRRLVSPQGMVVPLSNAEFRLLSVFLASPRRLFTRDQLMEQARGRSMQAFERSIDLLVSRLRQKLAGTADEPSLIKTVRGAGYIFNARSVHA